MREWVTCGPKTCDSVIYELEKEVNLGTCGPGYVGLTKVGRRAVGLKNPLSEWILRLLGMDSPRCERSWIDLLVKKRKISFRITLDL